MKIKKLQKLIDKGINVLSDHDDKKDQDRYINLQKIIQECQEYIEKGNFIDSVTEELIKDLIDAIKEFEEDRFIFIIFLIILCGLLFIGVFYITYSHFYVHLNNRPGGHIKPSMKTTTTITSTTDIPIITDPTTNTTTTNVIDKTETTKITSKTTTQTATTKPSTVITTTVAPTTKPKPEEPNEEDGFVTVIFDNSSLVDLENIIPIDDEIGLTTTPTKWSLSSTLSNGSKNYILTYYIDFIDVLDEIPVEKRLDISNLKYQLLIKKKGNIIYDSQVQDMYDYPESSEGVRPIITGKTYKNDEQLDFELRMWLDKTTGNSEQGKQYTFKINVSATYEFID